MWASFIEWLGAHPGLLWGAGVASLALVVASVIVVPMLLTRMPADYFATRERRTTLIPTSSPMVATLLKVARNVGGWFLIIAGVAMLVLPGQGLLTILVGLVLVDLPGKRRFVRKIVARNSVLRSINWLRKRAGADPLELEPRDSDGGDEDG